MSVASLRSPLCWVIAHAPGNPDGNPSAGASETWIAKWEAEREKYKRLNLPISRLKDRIIRHKASLILDREFGEDPESYLERRGLTDYYKWKEYEQWDSHAQARGNPDGASKVDEWLRTATCVRDNLMKIQGPVGGFCGEAAYALAHLIDGTVVLGSYQFEGKPSEFENPHYWVEKEGYIIDPTAEQYGEFEGPIVIKIGDKHYVYTEDTFRDEPSEVRRLLKKGLIDHAISMSTIEELLKANCTAGIGLSKRRPEIEAMAIEHPFIHVDSAGVKETFIYSDHPVAIVDVFEFGGMWNPVNRLIMFDSKTWGMLNEEEKRILLDHEIVEREFAMEDYAQYQSHSDAVGANHAKANVIISERYGAEVIDDLIARGLLANEAHIGNPERQLSQAIREVVKEYRRQGKSPEDINIGWCEPFADEVIKRVPHADYGSTDDYTDINETALIGGRRAAFPGHTWIRYKGRHYDSEAPEGVDRWFDLPIFHRESELASWSAEEKRRIKWE